MASEITHTTPIHLNIAPLIDMVFLLLIFFLLTSNFILEEGIKLSLPVATSSQVHQEEEIIVSVDRENLITINQQPVDMSSFVSALQKVIQGRTDQPVVLKADREIKFGKAIAVLDAVKSARVKKIIIATEIEKEKK